MDRKLYQELASLVQARLNCIEAANKEWLDKHEDRIESLVKNYMPSGSGIDNGTHIDLDNSNGKRLVFHTAYHHMNENGYYDGWTSHTVTVTPGWNGPELRITGRDRNQIKDYLYDTFHYALCEQLSKEAVS